MNSFYVQAHSAPAKAAFSRVDLMASVAMLGIFALLGAPALGKSRSSSSATICLNNGRQLIDAWTGFTHDNGGRLPGSIHGGPSQAHDQNAQTYNPANQFFQPWATGWLDWGNRDDNTNSAYLTDPRYASTALYVGIGKNVEKCPNDRYLSDVQRNSYKYSARVRSVAGNIAVGDGNAEAGPWNSIYRHVKNISEVDPSVFMHVEENADSLNDTAFWSPSGSQRGNLNWISVPANYHDGGAMVTFVDAHVEIHRWQKPVADLVPTARENSLSNAGRNQTDLSFFFDRTPKL